MSPTDTPQTPSEQPAAVLDQAHTLPDGAPPFEMAPDGKKKRKTRRPIEAPGGLSMNSLMDIMTIILVFLLKSYSTNPVQLKQTADLKPPSSKSQLIPKESTAVTVTVNHILINDEPVVKLTEGIIDKGDIDSGGFLIQPLFSKLEEEVSHQKKVGEFNDSAKFKGVVTLIADRHVSFKLLSQVMYTAGQAQFSKFKFLVIKNG